MHGDRPRTALFWTAVNAIFDGSTRILLEMGDLRRTLTSSGAIITATGLRR